MLVVQLNDWFPSLPVGCFLCNVVKKSVARKIWFHGAQEGLFASAQSSSTACLTKFEALATRDVPVNVY